MKNKKTLLKIGLVLLAVALGIGAGFFLTGSVVFARNAIALALLGGAGIGVATPIVNGAKKFFTNRAEKKEQDYRNRTLELNRAKEKIQNMGNIPVSENNVDLNDTVVQSTVKSTNTKKTVK